MKKILSTILAFVFCVSLVCVPAVAADYVTYDLVVVDNGDGTATVTAFAPAGVFSGKIVVCTNDNLSYIAGSGVSAYVLNESYDRNGVKGVCVTFASAVQVKEKIEIFKGLYKIAEGKTLGSGDVYSAEWNLTNGQDTIGSQANGNVEVEVEYITYTVTFVGKNGETLKTETVIQGSSASAPEVPEIEGYDFAGWDKAFDNVKSDLTVTALYSEIVFTVTFIGKDGEVLKSGPVGYGKDAVAPEALAVEGYSFKGWDKGFTNVTEELTVNAVYEINQYTVKFLCLRGDVLKTEIVTYGASATPPEAPEIEGYTFKGWDKEYDVIKGDTSITTVYEINKYTVTFIGKNGETLSTQRVAYDYFATAPEAPQVEGFVFLRWDTDFTSIKADTTVTAVYGHSVTFVGFDGATIETVYVNHGDNAVAPAAPEVKGYTFKGWDKAFAEVTSNVTVTAIYELSGAFGDVNDDGKINNLDASSILKYDAGLYDNSDLVIALSDVNNDGRVNNLDASSILKYDAGIIPEL